MANINTLVDDIYRRVQDRTPFSKENVEKFSNNLNKRLEVSFAKEPKKELTASSLGTPCMRHLWYKVNHPELAEPMPPFAYIKFFYGDVIEELLLLLAREAGHKVEGEQQRLQWEGVNGTRDAVIDGRIVDCKSASSIQFEKFDKHTLHESDAFGYLDQLDFYAHAAIAADDPLVTDRKNVSFLVMDKTLGHVCLTTYPVTKDGPIEKLRTASASVTLPEPPPCTCEIVPKGKSGNMGLGVNPSYSAYKRLCRPDLREFRYANGPEYLTKVVKVPKVPEVVNGKLIYPMD